MARSFPAAEGGPIELEDFIARADAIVDPEEVSSLEAMVGAFQALGRNRRFFVEHLLRRLKVRREEVWSDQNAAVFNLHRTPRYTLRALVWFPREVAARSPLADSHALHYDVVHDHTFSFLTTGYHGSGYQTWIYELEEPVERRIGATVPLRFLEQTRLEPGKTMLYKALRDVHHKAHPAELSISLNLMIQSRAHAALEPLSIDVASGRVRGFFGQKSLRREQLCVLAGRLGDPRAEAPLAAIARAHPSPRVRRSAYEGLALLAVDVADTVWKRALRDPDEAVQGRARAGLEGR